MAKKLNKKLGKKYKDLREELSTMEKDCTQDMLAKKLGLTKPQISNLENGKREPSLTELKAYSKYFNCPMEYLTGDKDNRRYETGLVCKELGLSDKSIETLQLIKQKRNLKESPSKIPFVWHNYYHYIEIIDLLIQYGNFNDLIQILHDYLFFDTSKANFVDFVNIPDKKGNERIKELPLDCVHISDKNNVLSVSANDLSEPILEAILMSKLKSLKKVIQENNLNNIKSLLQEEEIRNKNSRIEAKNGKSEKN